MKIIVSVHVSPNYISLIVNSGRPLSQFLLLRRLFSVVHSTAKHGMQGYTQNAARKYQLVLHITKP